MDQDSRQNHFLITIKHPISMISVILSFIALILAFLWFFTTREFEPLITSIGIAAAILTVFIDPWLEKRSQRTDIIKSLYFEIILNSKCINMEIFDTKLEISTEFTIYPRLISSCLDRALSSGLFNDDKHKELRNSLMIARTKIDYFNSYMSLFEINELSQTPEARLTAHNNLKSSPLFTWFREQFSELTIILGQNYSSEIGVTQSANTISGMRTESEGGQA